MELIDTHAHLQSAVFAGDLDAVMERAAGVGVQWICCNGTSPQDWDAVLSLARRYPGDGSGARARPRIIPCLGLHPWYLHRRTPDWLERLDDLLSFVPAGVGEIGLDRWRGRRDEALQEEIFRAQLDLARRHGRPAVVHCLRAWGWLSDVLGTEEDLPGGLVIHAYGGSVETARLLVRRGAYLSFACNVLRAESRRCRAAAAAVPVERILVETDAPDIPPPAELGLTGPRLEDGRLRTEPSFVAAVLRGIAELRGIKVEELAEAVEQNARRLWGDLLHAPAGTSRMQAEEQAARRTENPGTGVTNERRARDR